MNIISGKYKYALLKSPNDERTHPMGNREKLALFNMLTGEIEGKTVLDAFAGSGALGLEALSRGAKTVVFVEKSKKVAEILKENVKNVTKTSENTKIVVSSLENFETDEKFDLIFADPPYDSYSEAILGPLERLLSKSGILALSLPKTAPDPVFEGLEPLSRRFYASASVALFQKS